MNLDELRADRPDLDCEPQQAGGIPRNLQLDETTGFIQWLGARNAPRSFLHTPEQGARASIQAVTTDLPSGTYLAPRFNQWGRPRVTKLRAKARDPVMARALWELSAELTGCDWQTH